MFSLLFILALLSLPLFTIYGFFSFLKLFFGGSNPNQNQLLNEFLIDLDLLKSKRTTASQLQDKYKSRLTGVPTGATTPAVVQEEIVPPTVPIPTQTKIENKTSLGNDLENWWENWYQDNNINLLLYIGAFLIVSSAAIFVGFNWENFPGTLKAFVLSTLTLTFFLAGFFFFFQNPKLRNAGSTFLAIGSLLIPFNGLAWYNFVLRDAEVSFGVVWLITSVVAALTYFSLAVTIKNRFYTYIAGLGTLSLIEALVNVSALNTKFYVLGGIFSAFTLLAGSHLIANTKKSEFEELYSEPLNISSQITMPIFLVWGLSLAAGQNQLFTLEATLSTFLACLFYLLIFTLKRNMVYLLLSELLLAMTLVLGLITFEFTGPIVYLSIYLLCFAYLTIALIRNRLAEGEEGYYTIFTAIFIALLSLPFAFIDQLISPTHQVFFTLIVSVGTAAAAIIQRQPNYLYFSIGGANLAYFVYVNSVLQKTDWYNNLGLVYFGFALILLGLTLLGKIFTQRYKQVFLIGAYWNLLLATTFNLNSPENIMLLSLLILGASTIYRFFSQKQELIFSPLVATGLACISLVLLFALPDYSTTEQIYFSTIAAAIAFLAAYLEKRPEYLFVAFSAVDLAGYLQISEFDLKQNSSYVIGLFFAALATAQYVWSISVWKRFNPWAINILIFSVINLTLALIFTISSPGYSLFTTALVAAISFSALWYLQKEEAGYIGVTFLVASVFNIFRFFEIPTELYPLGFMALSYCLYLLSLAQLPNLFGRVFKYSGMLIGVTNPIAFGFYSQNQSDYYYDGYQYQEKVQTNSLELYSLISAYLATLMLSIEAYRTRMVQIGYFASAVGLLTLLWHFKFLNFDEIQIYSITTAIYLFVIGFTREKLGKTEERRIFDYSAVAILLSPAILQALPESGFWYAMLLGGLGLGLLTVGLSLNHKTFTYAGVAAVVIATLTRIYSFIASLGSWAIIGSLGLIFLSVAVFLLSKRKDI